jgi:hypothetical protein
MDGRTRGLFVVLICGFFNRSTQLEHFKINIFEGKRLFLAIFQENGQADMRLQVSLALSLHMCVCVYIYIHTHTYGESSRFAPFSHQFSRKPMETPLAGLYAPWLQNMITDGAARRSRNNDIY